MIKVIDNGDFAAVSSEFEVTCTTDPEELAKACAQHEQFKRNCDWLEAHAAEVYRHRGKHFCIAGQELFIADSAAEAWALGAVAHAQDAGRFVEYIPQDKLPRIYAYQRLVVSL